MEHIGTGTGTGGRFCCPLIPNPINQPPGQEVPPSCPAFMPPSDEGGGFAVGEDGGRDDYPSVLLPKIGNKTVPLTRGAFWVRLLCHCYASCKLAWQSHRRKLLLLPVCQNTKPLTKRFLLWFPVCSLAICLRCTLTTATRSQDKGTVLPSPNSQSI